MAIFLDSAAFGMLLDYVTFHTCDVIKLPIIDFLSGYALTTTFRGGRI